MPHRSGGEFKDYHTLTWRYEEGKFVYVFDKVAMGMDGDGVRRLKGIELAKGARVAVYLGDDPWPRPQAGAPGPFTTFSELLPQGDTGLPRFWLDKGITVTYHDRSNRQIEVHVLRYEDFGTPEYDQGRARYIFDGRYLGTGESGEAALREARIRKGSLVQVICPWALGPSSWYPQPPGIDVLLWWGSRGIMVDVEEESGHYSR
ncbi:MAG TPA: hypothetical protein VMW24_06755 [Sedimentisphaerales bacterium]|nr:hypothetical protein [Sedimentisphaerales bacterium]